MTNMTILETLLSLFFKVVIAAKIAINSVCWSGKLLRSNAIGLCAED